MKVQLTSITGFDDKFNFGREMLFRWGGYYNGDRNDIQCPNIQFPSDCGNACKRTK